MKQNQKSRKKLFALQKIDDIPSVETGKDYRLKKI